MSESGPRELTVLDKASKLLAEAKTLDEIKSIRNQADAARTYAKAAKLGLELQNHAAEVKLRAERKAGSFLSSLNMRGGDRRSKGQRAPLKLEDLEISRDQSKRWQKLASVSEKEFQLYLKAASDLGQEISTVGLLRISNGSRSNQSRKAQHKSVPIDAIIPMSGHRENASDNASLLDELSNHCQILASVLEPVYEGGNLEFKQGERRHVGHLIKEINEVIKQLRKALDHSARA